MHTSSVQYTFPFLQRRLPSWHYIDSLAGTIAVYTSVHMETNMVCIVHAHICTLVVHFRFYSVESLAGTRLPIAHMQSVNMSNNHCVHRGE